MRSQSVAVVTGAAQGIGRRIAEVLAQQGFALAVLDRQPVTGLDLALSSAADVRDEAEVGGFARQVLDQLGRVDVLVNNAGIACIQPLEETTLAQWRDVIEVNLTGPFLLCREFGRAMLASGQGTIVNIASVAGLEGIADRAAYNASKHGLVGLTRTLAAEWGGRGVRVNAVCPGWVKRRWTMPPRRRGRTGTAISSIMYPWDALQLRTTSPRPSRSWPILDAAVSSMERSCLSTAAGMLTGPGSRSAWPRVGAKREDERWRSQRAGRCRCPSYCECRRER
jgi:NAD(P)-dependent dehydrogenase (short-subunit alcohol dehydrogenase family)